MAFIPEDGTGLANANSLVTLEFADAYFVDHPARAAGKWAISTPDQKRESLMIATRFLLTPRRWKGSPINGTQALKLPRYWPEIDQRLWEPIPDPVKEAVCELANEDRAEPLGTALDRGGELLSEQIGPLAFGYSPTAPSGRTFPIVEDLIEDFLEAAGSQAEAILS